MNHNIALSEIELNAQLETIIDFLGNVHPNLHKKNNPYPVEIRPLLRGFYEYKLSRSVNLWNLDEKSVARLRGFLTLHNGVPCCLYYSVYCYDYDREPVTRKGKKASKGVITANNAMFADEIVLDFDGISYTEYTELYSRFEKLGIDGVWLFTGHGYQVHILLEEPVYDKSLLYKFVYKFRSKGFNCDTACVDPARVMRLPYTFNCKSFSDEAYEGESDNPPRCRIVQNTSRSYAVEELMLALNTLPTVSEEDEALYEKSFALTPSPGRAEGAGDSDSFTVEKAHLPYINKDDLPSPILKMLSFTPIGVRNSTLGFLIRHLKFNLTLSKSQIHEILSMWAEHSCDPVYSKDEFEQDFERLFFRNGLPYTGELAKEYGYIDFDGIQLQRKNKIFIPNPFLKGMSELSGNMVRVYLTIRKLEHLEEAPTIEAISDETSLAVSSVKRILSSLKKTEYIQVLKGAKRFGEPNKYISTKMDANLGFTQLSANDIEVYLSTNKRLKLTDGELKLFLFMLYKFYTKEFSMSRSRLGENIGVKQSTITSLVRGLEKKKYLKTSKRYKNTHIYYNIYTLLR